MLELVSCCKQARIIMRAVEGRPVMDSGVAPKEITKTNKIKNKAKNMQKNGFFTRRSAEPQDGFVALILPRAAQEDLYRVSLNLLAKEPKWSTRRQNIQSRGDVEFWALNKYHLSCASIHLVLFHRAVCPKSAIACLKVCLSLNSTMCMASVQFRYVSSESRCGVLWSDWGCLGCPLQYLCMQGALWNGRFKGRI